MTAPTTTAFPTSVPRRRWPRMLLLAIVILFGSPVAIYWYVSWSSARDTESLMAETTRLDPHWKLDDLEAQRVALAPDENSALHVIKVRGLAGGGAGLTSRPEFYEEFQDLEPQFELTALQVDLLRRALEGMGESLSEARKLKDMPRGRYPIKYSPEFIATLLPDQQNSRRVAELLQHDVWRRAQAGDLDGALQSCRAGINTARAMGDEPILISFLIRAAEDAVALAALERTLAQGRQPSEKELHALQALLEQEGADLSKHWLNSLRGERAGGQRIIQAMHDGKLKVSGLMGMTTGGPPNFAERLVDYAPAIVTREYPTMLRYMNEAVAIANLPTEQQLDRLRGLEKTIPQRSILVRQLAPALQNVGHAHLRLLAQLRSAQVAVACERFRLKQETPRWPESFAELEKAGLISKTPTDPHDGAPLRMRRRDDGLSCYSVGIDRTDDGGKINPSKAHEKGYDVGFRLWDVERRRQAPRPPMVQNGP